MVAIILYYYIYIIIYRGKTKESRREGRENQCKGCLRHLRQFLASLLFRLRLHRPHHRQPLTTSPACVSAQGKDGRPPRPLLGDAIAATSAPIEQQPAAVHRLDGLPSCPPRPLPRHLPSFRW